MSETCKKKILSEDFRDFLIPAFRKNEELTYPAGSCLQDLGLGYTGLYMDKAQAGEITIETYGYNTIPGCYGLLGDEALISSGISAVQNYPSLSLTGKGVMIGIVDTGIDYTNPVFLDETNQTRIVEIWDQTIQTGTPPQGFAYGSAYSREDIQRALRAEDPLSQVPSTDEIGHGTFLASVAAGQSTDSGAFQGAAPLASIGVVKLKPAKQYLKDFYRISENAICYQETDILSGLFYLYQLAKETGQLLVLSMGLGSNFGSHAGTSMLSLALSEYASILNCCVVIGTGNEAANRHHFHGTLSGEGAIREAQLRVETDVTGFVAELWSEIPDIVTVYVTSPSGERSRTISLRQGSRYTLDFFLDNTQVDVEYRLQIDVSNSQLIFLRFSGVANGIWTIGVQSVHFSTGDFDIWLPIQDFLESDVYFLESDPYITLTEPGSAGRAITVSYYNSEENSVDINAGRGYTRDNIIKPELAVPGVGITGAGKNHLFLSRTGSSASLGLAAGGCALLMEWLNAQSSVHGVNSSQVRNILVIGARGRSTDTYPNREWGYGMMDLYQSLQRLREL